MGALLSPSPADLDALLARAAGPAARALELHPFYRGKVQIAPKCPVRGIDDFAVWYTPGVAAVCRAIAADPEKVYQHTNRGNLVAVVSDGSRVLGLGDIGPRAGLPVMEGKSLLFKYLGGVDAVPLCVDVHDVEGLVDLMAAIEPSFGGINLEDIAQPRCFRVLAEARERLSIPVWHDDQQGTATVTLAALENALLVVGKRLDEVEIVLHGVGAANVATYRLLTAAGVPPPHVVAVDSRGVLHPDRDDLVFHRDVYVEKWRMCEATNGRRVRGGAEEALRGADVCISYSTPGSDVLEPTWLAGMADDAILFACANPVPEIWPWDAREAGARIVATGRSDFPNQVNNSLGFPGIFRGVLDVRARTITDGMALAAARELAAFARARGIHEESILPAMTEWEVYPRVAATVGVQAQQDGVTSSTASWAQLHAEAMATVVEARRTTQVLMEHVIAEPPA